jgi:hypothetical protein
MIPIIIKIDNIRINANDIVWFCAAGERQTKITLRSVDTMFCVDVSVDEFEKMIKDAIALSAVDVVEQVIDYCKIIYE